MPNLWELEHAQKAIRDGDIRLANRYISKALERVRCMYCHGGLNDSKPHRPHFKGFVHYECAEKYNGRTDYENQHPGATP